MPWPGPRNCRNRDGKGFRQVGRQVPNFGSFAPGVTGKSTPTVRSRSRSVRLTAAPLAYPSGARMDTKGRPKNAKRGLIIPSNLHDLPDPVLIVEGASDVAACAAVGLAAVGRPSNRSVEGLSELLKGREALVVGERDGKPDGNWPGRDGAQAAAQILAGDFKKPVAWTLPPHPFKDIREWTIRQIESRSLSDATYVGQELLAELRRTAESETPEGKQRQADELAGIIRQNYRLIRSTEGEPFAVPNDRPGLAIPLRGNTSLRGAVARTYKQRTGRIPHASALKDATHFGRRRGHG